MWVWLVVMSAWAQDTPEVDAAGDGALRITAVLEQDHSIVREAWEKAVRKAERAWRRASRRSDEPIEPPDIPEPDPQGVGEVQLVLTSDALEGGILEVQTNDDGVWEAPVPAGLYKVVALPPGGPTVTVSGVKVDPGRTRPLTIAVEPWSDVQVITSTHGASPYAGGW